MRLRAEQIGALLEVRSAQTSGTIVSLTFSPRAKDRRLKHEHRRGAKL
jgi:nitrate/nitrite-specific signal transduction histidine kinase